MTTPIEIAFVEQRTYVLYPGQTSAYLKAYQDEGLHVQLPVLGNLVGYYSVEVGGLNTVIHMWAFTSHDERELRRARLQANPDWQAYWAKVRPMIVSQQSIFLKPAAFFSERLSSMMGAVIAAPLSKPNASSTP